MQHPQRGYQHCTKLFDFVVVVGLRPNEEKGGVVMPYIKHVFPSESEASRLSFMKSIPEFCFPDIHAVLDPKQRGGAGVETFSFVLTETTGEKRWAYCRRTKITSSEMGSHKDTGNNFPHLCFCIVSFIPCFSIFSVLLDEILGLQRARSGDFTLTNSFLNAIYEKPLPPPGETLQVSFTNPVKSETKEYSFKRPDDSDSLLGHVDFEPLLLSLSPINILSIFASLLVERRIIFIANKLSTLSTCVQAAIAVLYPLSWQHIFIPVLPKSMLTFCCAPMPFVVGILRSCLPFLAELSNGLEEEIIVVDIDRNKITSPQSVNDKALLPPTLIAPLLSSLQNFAKEVKAKHPTFSFLKRDKKGSTPSSSGGSGGATGGSGGSGGAFASVVGGDTQQANLAKDMSNAFISFMVDLLKDYRDHLVHNKQRIRIDRESYLEARPQEVRPLLKLVVQTQMFEMFIQDRATRLNTNGAFERMSMMIDGKIASPLSRFTMYENGDISKEDITKKVREMLMDAEEKEKEQASPPVRRETVTTRPKGGFADFWNRLWNDEPEPEIQIGGPDHSSFKKVPHPNQAEAYEWLRSTGKDPMAGAEKAPEWKSAEVEVDGDKPDGGWRTYCLDGDKCKNPDPTHWTTFQHVYKHKEGPLFYYILAILALDNWQPRWCILGRKELAIFKGNDNPTLLARHELKSIKSVTLHAFEPVTKRKFCLEVERVNPSDDRTYLSAPTYEEAKAWLNACKEVGLTCQERT